jgi:hypothetical protein
VRSGADVLLKRDRKTKAVVHTATVVYREMIRQICRDYSGLPDVRTLTVEEIVFFYDGLRPELKEATKQKKPR